MPTTLVLVVFVSLCWIDDCCHSPLATTEIPADEGGGRLSTKQVVSNGEGIRLAIFLVSAALVGSCAVITLVCWRTDNCHAKVVYCVCFLDSVLHSRIGCR